MFLDLFGQIFQYFFTQLLGAIISIIFFSKYAKNKEMSLENNYLHFIYH